MFLVHDFHVVPQTQSVTKPRVTDLGFSASRIASEMQRKSPVTAKCLFFYCFLVACAPGRVTIQEDPPGHLSVAWSSAELGDYYVAFVKSDDGLEEHCNTSFTRCDFLSECGFTYFISVFAYNKAGQSPLGDVFSYTTGESHLGLVKVVWSSADSLHRRMNFSSLIGHLGVIPGWRRV